MKAFNLIALTMALALLSVGTVCVIGDYLFNADTAKFVVMPFALLIGLSARRITEKILGYTLLEAMKDGETK